MKKEIHDDPRKYLNQFGDTLNKTDTASAWECTGMFYRPPQNDEEYEHLKEMYSMSLPDKESSKKSDGKR